MRRLVRVLGTGILLGLLLFAGLLSYSTWRGYTHWYFRVNGDVIVNGQQTTGYLHASTDKTLLLLTRTDDSQRETYVISLGQVSLGGEGAVADCGGWHPVRFLPYAVGHWNSPCSASTVDAVKPHDPPVPATLTTGRNFIQFSTASGKKVRGQW
jgi:hypothetical protein